MLCCILIVLVFVNTTFCIDTPVGILHVKCFLNVSAFSASSDIASLLVSLTAPSLHCSECMDGIFTHGTEPFFRSPQLCNHSRTSQYLMEPEVSLPCSQEPSTTLYPEPDQSSPYHPILSKIHFNIVHPPMSWSS
jgi:hypothetical protein